MSGNATPHSASAYDGGVVATIPYYRSFHEEAMRLVGAVSPSPRSWLDSGCGTGTLAAAAAQRFPATSFSLCDPSREMLEIAAAKTARLDAKVIGAYATADIPPAYDGSFDVVTAIQAHHYLDRRGRDSSSKRCFELLRSGGLYIVFENTAPLTDEGARILKDYWKAFQVESGKSEEEARAHLRRYGVEYFPITVPEQLAGLRSAGFSVVELFWYSYMQSGYFCVK